MRETPSFDVSDAEQTQDDQYLKLLYDTRAVNIIGAQAEDDRVGGLDYNRTIGRVSHKDYLKNKEFRLNMVGNRILMAAYPLCPERRRSRSMMVGISGGARSRPQIDWAITPFYQADNATLQLGDEILGMGDEDLQPGIGSLLRARAILADYANRMEPLKFHVRRDDRILHITQQPAKFCSYDFVMEKDDTFNASADDKTIHVNTQVFNYLETDDELAFIIGHETSHNIMRHIPKERYLRIVDFLTRIFTLPTTIGGAAASNTASSLTMNGFSRQFESEADYVGVYLATAAGYDPEAALSAAQVMARDNPEYITGSGMEDPSGGASNSYLWADHPPNGERYTQLRKAVEEIKLKQSEGLPVMPEFLY